MHKILGLLLFSAVALSAPEDPKTNQQGTQQGGNTRFFNQNAQGGFGNQGHFGGGFQSGGRPIGGQFPGQGIGGHFPGRPTGGHFPGRPTGGHFPGRPIGGHIPGRPIGGQFPGQGGFPIGSVSPPIVGPPRPPIGGGCFTAGPVSPPKGNCQKWTQDSCGRWVCSVSQKAFRCPAVRPQCPPTRFHLHVGPQVCHNDNDCAANDKCCLDACFPGQLICKGPE